MEKIKTPTVSIIVPCYNENNTIQLLLESIYQQTYPLNKLEVIISDAMSEDGTRARIQEFTNKYNDLKVIVVDNTKRTIPAGVNSAAKAATGEYLVRVDAHSKPYPNYVEKCIQNLIKDKGTNVGGVWEIHPGDNTWIAESISAAAANPLAVGGARYRYSNKAGYVDTVPFGSFKRKTFFDLGAFDETLLANEDYEFNARLKKSGGKIWFDPEIKCVYYARKRLIDLAKQYWRYGFWKYKMLKRYPKTLRLRQALPPVFVFGNFAFIVISIFNQKILPYYLVALGFYLMILFLAAIYSAIKKGNLRIVFGIPLATVTMHVFWGAGFIYSLISHN